MRFCSLLFLLAALQTAGLRSQTAPGLAVDVVVLDESRQPISGVHLKLKSGAEEVAATDTDASGHAAFRELKVGHYDLNAAKAGFEAAQARGIDLSSEAPASVEIVLVPIPSVPQSIEVHETVAPAGAGSSAPQSISTQIAKQLPARPATVTDALPMLPGVVREPGGGLVISGSPENRNALIVNSADVTDPATGQFGLTVPIDSVEAVNVYQTPYLAQYGRFTGGIVSVETRRGGDTWKWELNDPLPEFRIRSYQLRGLKDATPRLNFEGPIVPGKFFLSEGFEYEVRRTAVYTLPFPHNQKKTEGINSFSQIDWVASPTQLLTATVHAAPQRLGFANMDYFNPEQTAPDASTHNYTGTLADHLGLHSGLLDSVFSVTHFDAGVWGQGSEDLVITPGGNRGNYFVQQGRDAKRTSSSSTYSFAPIKKGGRHEPKAGVALTWSSEQGGVSEHPVDIRDASNALVERIVFPRIHDFEIDDREAVIFGQDQWTISPRLAIDLGVRAETQQVAGTLRVAPRAGIVWQPFTGTGTAVRVGTGLFYDRVPLNVFAFNRYPDRVVTFYGPDGEIAAGPTLYLNTLGQVRVRSPFVSQKPIDGNFSPRSTIASLQVEQPITPFLRVRAGYLQNQSAGLVVLDAVPPDPTTSNGAYLLGGGGSSRYHQVELTARVRAGKAREVFLSYLRSRARGALNEFGGFLGTFPAAIIRDNRYVTLPTDVPGRLLAWGNVELPSRFRIVPVFEYRTGFPYSATDTAQNYVGQPNQYRFPNLLSVDSRVSKDIPVGPKYSVRLSLSAFNLTNHFNPEGVHNNIGDPASGFFFGHRGRRFTADFDVLF